MYRYIGLPVVLMGVGRWLSEKRSREDFESVFFCKRNLWIFCHLPSKRSAQRGPPLPSDGVWQRDFKLIWAYIQPRVVFQIFLYFSKGLDHTKVSISFTSLILLFFLTELVLEPCECEWLVQLCGPSENVRAQRSLQRWTASTTSSHSRPALIFL